MGESLIRSDQFDAWVISGLKLVDYVGRMPDNWLRFARVAWVLHAQIHMFDVSFFIRCHAGIAL